ncbi:MAG TPA: hypothetical protein VF003_05445 [Pseudonocardiaceae bacterium]
MAITKDSVKYVQIEGVQVWAAPDGSIQLSADDPDEKTRKLFWMTFSPKENSVNYHAPTYRKLAEILEHHRKTVPGRTGS